MPGPATSAARSMCESSASAAAENSGSRPRSCIARRAMLRRRFRFDMGAILALPHPAVFRALRHAFAARTLTLFLELDAFAIGDRLPVPVIGDHGIPAV